MQKIFKSISKLTGNLCFAASKDESDYICYASRYNKVVSYVSCRLIEGLAFHKFSAGNDYFVITHGDNWLSLFNGSTVNNLYVNVSPYKLSEIVKGQNNNFFAIDSINKKLIKFNLDFSSPSFSLLWELSLNNFNFSQTGIIYRGSNQTIVLNDNNTIYVIKDSDNYGIVINSIKIPGDQKTVVVASGEFNPELSNIRYKQFYGEQIAQSSTSSSSSWTSLSTMSSTSSSSSSLITSSSSSLITSSSSSSFKYSTSSSFAYSISSESTSSSSLFDAFIKVDAISMNWESASNFDYLDVTHQIRSYYNSNTVPSTDNNIYLQPDSFDINGDVIYRVRVKNSCVLRISTNKGTNPGSNTMYIYRNGTLIDSFIISNFGGAITPRLTTVTMNGNFTDELRIRMKNTIFDLFNYQVYSNDNRRRTRFVDI